MAEQIVEYQIGADAEAVKKALAEVEAAAQKLGNSIAQSLGKGGADGTKNLGQAIDKGIRDSERTASRSALSVGTALGRGLGGAIAVAVSAVLSGEVIKALTDVGDLAKRVGLSVERVQAIRDAGFKEGISTKDIDKGLESLGSRANEQFREGEGDLKELLEANNLKITDRQGKLKDVNSLLEDAAKLVSNANTEFDKVDIARIFGLSQDWVKVLEQGPEALRAAITAAQEAGSVIDSDLVAKADAFDKAWREAWASFTTNAKAAIATAAGAIASLINSIPSSGAISDLIQREGEARAGTIRDDGETARALAFNRIGTNSGLDVTIKPKRGGTKIPGKKSGGSPGGGKSDEDSALSRLENYTQALQRQGDVLAAEIETFGKSNAERKSAIELAKAKNDLDKLDEETKARVSEQIRAAVQVNEQYRESLDRLKGAQQAANFAAEQFADALGDIIIDGKNAEDVLKGLVKNFARQAINSFVSGNGAFAGLFGQQKGGIFGTLFSGLFGGKFADGGELPRGISLVGERGPELVRNSGSGVARVYPSGQGPGSAMGGSSQVVNIDARGADAGAVSRIEAAVRAMDRQFSARVISVNRQSQVRGIA